MFIVPFLKYFRPYVGRILLAVFGMVMVALLSAAPIFIMKQAVDLLVGQRRAGQTAEPATPNGAAEGLQALTGVALPPTATAGDARASVRERVDRALARWLGALYTVPRDRIMPPVRTLEARVRAWKQRYEALAAEHPIAALRTLVVLLIAVSLLKGAFEFLAKYQLAHTLFMSNLRIREDLFRHVLDQDFVFFNRYSPGYLHSRINSDVKALGDILESLLQDGFQQPITLAVMFTILMVLSPMLTVSVMVVLPFIGAILYYFARVLRKNQRRQKRHADQLSSCLTESLTNIRLVKALGTEALEVEKFHRQSMNLFRSLMARRVAKFGSSPVMELLGSIAFGGALLLAGWMVLRPDSRMDFSTLFVYFYTLTRFYRPIKSLANMTNKYQVARVSAERMLDLMSRQPTVVQAADPRPFVALRESIVFDNVGFRFGEKMILSGISMTVRAGQRVALVGPSGAGKTTLVNLLARLFDPTEGRIVIDGVDLRQIDLRQWRARLAIVTQETFLFDDTVAANIAYGAGAIDMARVEAAARAANAHEFILALDGGKGYHTRLGPSGARLSGGQRQRIAIARALYRDPQILILDEATSALDVESQAQVQQALDRLMRGRTTFIVAHRLSTVYHADCIYVLDSGRIVESGTHEELVARGGHYAALMMRALPRGPTSVEAVAGS